MARRILINVAMGGMLAVAGQFICSPVFAENPVNISIVEVVGDGAGGYELWQDITGVMPGEIYSATPIVKNEGELPVSVRMCLSESAVSAMGESMELPLFVFIIDIDEHWVLDDKTVGGKKCYEYDSVLEPGSATEAIFTELQLSPTLENEYKNATFSLHLDAFAMGDYPDDSDEEPAELIKPSNPDTGANTEKETLSAIGVIPYVLGVEALVVLVVHLIKGLFQRRTRE